MREQLIGTALRLHRHLFLRHVRDAVLAGPDPGIKLNLRMWRFFKSYAGLTYGPERHVFMQGTAYWIKANWLLFDLEGNPQCRNLARDGSDSLLRLQREDGSWHYPLRERKHLVATIEGNWASLALMESFRRTNEERYLLGALKWKHFVLEKIGFQNYENTLAVNYFDRPRGNIPNNTTNTLWMLSELQAYRPDPFVEEKMDGMEAFLHKVQRPNGEFPYIMASPYEKAKLHYLCYQYNAFEFLDLCNYYNSRRDNEILGMLERLAGFIDQGVDESGRTRASCSSKRPLIVYHTAASAMALWRAYTLGILASPEKSYRGFQYVMGQQKPDGSFPYSLYDYGILRDERSYPRYQAMILYFLCGAANDMRERG